MKVLVIASTNLKRTFRVRTNFFFIFLYPLVLILILGVTFGGGSTPRVGVVASGTGPLGQAVVKELEKNPAIQVVSVGDSTSLLSEVERGSLSAGIEIPSDFDAAIRAGHNVVVTYLARPGRFTQQLGEAVRSVVAKQSAELGAAQFATGQGAAASFDSALSAATQASGQAPSVTVSETRVGTSAFSQAVGEYDQGAWTELLLFLFLTALMGGSIALIQARRLGVSRRMLATPTTPATVIAGEVCGRLLVGTVQAMVIIVGSVLLFGVKWGQPASVAAVVILFMVVSAGAGVFMGALMRNEQQAQGLGILLGLGLAAIGGCMVPLQVFSPTMQKIAHITPHAWANDAFAQVVGNGASITAILPQLGVLAAFAVVLLTLASWRLRRVLTA